MASLADHPAGDPFGRAPFEQQAQPGARLAGRYRLERLLRIYPGPHEPHPQSWIGFDEVLNRKVGIDVIASGHPQAPAVEIAARNAATVADVRFVQVLDVAAEDDIVYVVKEWIADAADLATRLADGPLAVPKANKIAQELTRAVAEAHGCEMPHGALNPTNILVTSTGEVKVLGLCLEAALAQAPAGAQAKEEDLRAIGCVWYAALTGRWPAESAAYGIPGAPCSHGRPFSPAQIRAAIPRPVDELVDSLVNPPADFLARIDSAKTLTGAIASLPRFREETDSTRVMAPTPAAARPAQQQRRQAPPPATSREGQQPPPVPAAHSAGPYPAAASADGGGRRVSGGVVAAAVAAVVAIGALVYFNLGGSTNTKNGAGGGTPSASSTSSSASASAALLPISTASIWDSDKGTDNAKYLQDAYDGSTSGWRTSTYDAGPSIAPYRAGTGIIFDLGSAQSVGSVTFDVGIAGATTQVWTAPASMTSLPAVSDEAPPGFTDQGTQTDDPAGQITVKFNSAVKTRFVMVWFTALPHQPQTQFDNEGYRDTLAEVKIYS